MARRGKNADGALPPFDGRDVITSAIKLAGAGTGLNDAVAVDPAPYHIGDKLFVVLEVDVASVGHQPIKDTDCLTRVHTIKPVTATFVDADLVADHLEKHRIRLEEAKGVHRLPLAEEDPADPAQTPDEAWEGPTE